ncbi:hypothetical protein LV780_16670 [Cereibacter azotoformans]|uniref:Uncharacterized protein n=1 Tax=Cereibacter azotoformans TaxID=43057 RepID=A0A2T5JTG2_9RHOB|nr:hypothetical protein [Cereibacter azotoformans]AXQ95738.1 hypothetical protein D0Z66_18595 [Cereibacter sphaeroides]PTR12965.1 hypothetical protein C8J28_12322 [Cereibacter azotoformans]UIJ32760.1 hypothetical protein LV780_16670 [Cereibacter azotoformans]
MTDRAPAPETLAAQALGRIDGATGALIPPIHPSTTDERDADTGYSRAIAGIARAAGRGWRWIPPWARRS